MAKFISGNEMIQEINQCKATYSHYLDDKYILPTITINSVEDIPENMLEAKKKLFKARFRSVAKFKPHLIEDSDVIFRVMDSSHVDRTIAIKKRHDTLPFPAFKHFIMVDGEPQEVLRSHWVGGFDNGHFSMTHGHLTKRMGEIIILMVRKNGTRANWRGYSYREEMESVAITQLSSVIMKFNDAKSDNAFAYTTTIMDNCFRKELATHKKQQGIKDELINLHGFLGSHGSRENPVEEMKSGECKVFTKDEIKQYLESNK